MSFLFICNSILLGAALAMDAFSVSLANGLEDPGMRPGRVCGIAGVFAAFQIAMPLIGWVCIYTIAEYFDAFRAWIPWIALALLAFLGGKMLVEGIRDLQQDAALKGAPNATDAENETGATAEGETGVTIVSLK